MNIFDNYGKVAFGIIKNTFGYSAVWKKTDGTPDITKDVLYKCPTDKQDFGTNNFTPEDYSIEYYDDDFPGLYAAVEDGRREKIDIELSPGALKHFYTKDGKKKGDGKSVIVYLTELSL